MPQLENMLAASHGTVVTTRAHARPGSLTCAEIQAAGSNVQKCNTAGSRALPLFWHAMGKGSAETERSFHNEGEGRQLKECI